jgi:hypothetical protein
MIMGRDLGDDLACMRSGKPATPTHTNAVTCASLVRRRSDNGSDLVRDEEAVGSNPATPTIRCPDQ